MKPICKIAIIENYTLLSSGLKLLLQAFDEIEVIADGATPQQLSMRLRGVTPDLILIDMLHCNNAGVKTIRKAKKYFPLIPFLLITNQNFTDCFNEYIRYGAKGFIFSDDSAEELIESIKVLCEGKNFFQKDYTAGSKVNTIQNSILSEREIDVLRLFCNGLTYKEIGKRLYISPRTVETHKKNILSKLKISSTAEMVKYAARHKLLSV